MKLLTILMPCIVIMCLYIVYIEACNEIICASTVSKCLITQACKCDPKKTNCSCCKECFTCLSALYEECCSCVDMCPKRHFNVSELGKKSSVEELKDPIPSLFTSILLVESEDWTTITYPIDFPKISAKDKDIGTAVVSQDVTIQPDIVTYNCTVAFMTQCISYATCEKTCKSFGANSYRWFHDGCCECVGEHCTNYGISESRCTKCPLIRNSKKPPVNTADLTYGEEANL